MTSDAPEQRARWYRRVLPVTGLLLAVGGLLVQVFPGIREQVALSATHRQQEYVALSFGRAADGTVVECAGSRRTVKVRFVVDSHLTHDRALTYRVTVGKVARKGSVRVDAGRTAEVTRAVRRPAGRFDVTVRLPEVDERVVAHCAGRAPSGSRSS